MKDTEDDLLLNWRNNKKKWSANLPREKLNRIRKTNAARQAERRKNETPEQAAERKKRDLIYKANQRARETPEEKEARLAKNAFYKTMCRKNETPERTAQRRQRDLLYKMRRRHQETLDQKSARLMANARCQSNRRKIDLNEDIFDLSRCDTPCMHCFSSDLRTMDINRIQFSDNEQIFTLGDCYSMLTGIKPDPEATAICQMCQDQLIMFYKFKRQFQHQKSMPNGEVKIKQEQTVPTFQTIILQDFLSVPALASLPTSFPPKIKLLSPAIRETSEGRSQTIQNQCRICLKIFTNPQGVHTHMETIHSETAGKYICYHCGYETVHKKYIRIHIMRHFCAFVCVVCKKAFKHRSVMKNHQQQQHVVSNAGVTELSAEQLGIKAQCPVCGVMVNERRLTPHLESHSDKVITCNLCPKTFNTQINFDKHMAKVHSKTFKFICEICGNGYDKQDKLNHHVGTHTVHKSGKHTCQHCQASFRFSTGLYHHTKKIHPDMCYKCSVPKCGEVLANQKSRDRHGNIHAAIATECLVCREKFENYFALYVHYETQHRRTRRFYSKNLKDNCRCECGAVFSTMNNLKYHIVQKVVGSKPTMCVALQETVSDVGRPFAPP